MRTLVYQRYIVSIKPSIDVRSHATRTNPGMGMAGVFIINFVVPALVVTLRHF